MLPKKTKVAAKVNVIEEKVEIDDQLNMKGLLAKEHKDVASLVVENPSMAEDKQEAGKAIVSSKDAAKESERKVEEKVFEETSKKEVAASAAAEKPPTKKAEPKLKEEAKANKLLDKEETMNKQDTKSANDNEETVDDDDEWISNMVKVFEFTVTLEDTSPEIWRTFQVLSSFTFSELHGAIKNCMGWISRHQHQFNMLHPKTKKLDLIGLKFNYGMVIDYPEIVDEREATIADYFTKDNKNAEYIYDFGDNWIHTITLDKILPIKEKGTYPNCVSGKLACPPEDVGGIDGFYNFLNIIKNPEHPEYEDMKCWIDDDGGYPSYDPDHFEPKEVIFESMYIMG